MVSIAVSPIIDATSVGCTEKVTSRTTTGKTSKADNRTTPIVRLGSFQPRLAMAA